MMAERKDQERPRGAGSDLRLQPAESGREAHPASGRLEIGPGEIVAEGVEAVVIINGKVPHAVLLELFTEHGAGTLIERRARKGRARGSR